MMKKTVKLTEKELHNVVSKSVKKILKENDNNQFDIDSWHCSHDNGDEYSDYAMPDGYDDEWNQGLDDEVSDWYETSGPHIEAGFKSSNLSREIPSWKKSDEVNSDWADLDKQRLDYKGGDFDLANHENWNTQDYKGTFGKMAQSNNPIDRMVGQDSKIFKSIKEATRSSINKVMKEAYVGTMRKKMYDQNPNEKSYMDIYSNGRNRSYTASNNNHLSQQDLSDIQNSVNEDITNGKRLQNKVNSPEIWKSKIFKMIQDMKQFCLDGKMAMVQSYAKNIMNYVEYYNKAAKYRIAHPSNDRFNSSQLNMGHVSNNRSNRMDNI